MDYWLPFVQLGIPILLFVLAFFSGSWVERKHYASIRTREEALIEMPAVTIRRAAIGDRPVAAATLVTGSVVISIDYFKRILAGLRGIVGGRVAAYETLVDRARREATLRMKEAAHREGADIVLNVRIETSSIGQDANGENAVGSIEALAYGTAVRLG